jgi:UDP-N-acetylmuramyl-tripeptide synthetase
MVLSEIVSRVETIRRPDGDGDDPEVTSISIDSRDVESGGLFVALPGARADGHDFIEGAVANGAAAVLVERDRLGEVAPPVPTLTAADTRRVLGRLAAEFYGHPSDELGVVGITGTNGKTTTTHLVGSVLRAAGREVGVIGTVGVNWSGHRETTANTTPGSLQTQQLLDCMRRDGVEEVVMEVSSHGLATHRLRGTIFDRGLLTNLTRDHLDFHEDMASYRRAKGRLFREHLPDALRRGKSPAAVLNVDDSFGRQLAGELRGEDIDVWTFSGRGTDADISVTAAERSLAGTTLKIDGDEGDHFVETPLLGGFNVENCAAAAAIGRSMGVAWGDIAAGLANTDGVPGRMERVGSGDDEPFAIVDYAHTPDALGRLLDTLAPLAPGRLVVVFGCGGDRDQKKRPMMGETAVSKADVAVVTSDNPRTEEPNAIIDDILSGISETSAGDLDRLGDEEAGVWVEPSRERAIDETLRRARGEDVVVIAGKGHETYQEIGRDRRPFDDRQKAEAALASRP